MDQGLDHVPARVLALLVQGPEAAVALVQTRVPADTSPPATRRTGKTGNRFYFRLSNMALSLV